MGSQITKIPSICGDGYPGVGFQVDNGNSVRVAMAWPSASAGGVAQPHDGGAEEAQSRD